MEYGEAEPVKMHPIVNRMRVAEEQCADNAAYIRVLEMLVEVLNWPGTARELADWAEYVCDLGEPDLGSDRVDSEDAIEASGIGWIEDTHGGATFVPYS